MTPPYPRIHVVINPGARKGQPVLKYLNDVCKEHGVAWDISLTRKYGDAYQQAKDALARGVELVVGCGGDGTQHEIANAIINTGQLMGILPGGTDNGFATEMKIPADFHKAEADFRVDDGILDVFVLSRNPISVLAAAERFFQIPSFKARMYYWRGRNIAIECEPSKAIWTDGELFGRTPVTASVVPGGLSVVVP